MMMAIGVIIVIAAWYRRERRTEGWQRLAIERQASARVGVQELRQRNRRVAASLLAVGAFMFTAAIVVGFLDHMRIH
jgi:hypothetical protein